MKAARNPNFTVHVSPNAVDVRQAAGSRERGSAILDGRGKPDTGNETTGHSSSGWRRGGGACTAPTTMMSATVVVRRSVHFWNHIVCSTVSTEILARLSVLVVHDASSALRQVAESSLIALLLLSSGFPGF